MALQEKINAILSEDERVNRAELCRDDRKH